MPAKSKKQYNFMQMVAHKKDDKGPGPSKKVAREIIEKTDAAKKKKFAKKSK